MNWTDPYRLGHRYPRYRVSARRAPGRLGVMKRILLRAGKSLFEALTPETTLERNLLGTNSGNLLFSNAAYRLLMTEGAQITINGMLFDPKKADQINEKYDVFVVPLASAFRGNFHDHLASLTALIKGLK